MMRLPDPTKTIEEQDDDILLAMLIFGEARGEKPDAQFAVGCVVRNRRLAGCYGGDTWEGVILRPLQFSCFNSNDVNRKKLLDPLGWDKPEIWEQCYAVAQSVLSGEQLDTTKRATHYHDSSLDFHLPFWAKCYIKTMEVGRLRFYRDPRAFKEPPEQDHPPEEWGES